MADKAFAYLSSSELTDVGLRRKNNEDAVLRLPENGVFCVADGMGGVQGGEVASKATMDAVRDEFTNSPDAPFALTAESSATLIERAVNQASRWIKTRADGMGLVGTGSTVVVLAFDRVTPSRAVALHAGDSRAYRYRADKLVQITVDHSVAAAAGLQDDNSLPAMFRGVITRAVGLDTRVILDRTDVDVLPGDLFLLCSDGLSKMLSDRQIQKIVRQHQAEGEDALAQALVAAALKEGGADNVSVVLVRVARDLPKGPTQEVPPETLALERTARETATAAAAGPSDEDRDETGETAESPANTSKTVAGSATPSEGTKVGTTPVTPVSDSGPVTPVSPSERAGRSGLGGGGRRPFAWLPGGPMTVWVLLIVLAAACVWWLARWREAKDRTEWQSPPVAPGHAEPAVAVMPPKTSAAPVEAETVERGEARE